jgi:hypothetical protein
VGGVDSGGNALNSIEVAPIHADGSLGAFAGFQVGGAASTLPTASSSPGLLTLGNGLCVFNAATAVQCSAISAADALAAFAGVTTPAIVGGSRLMFTTGTNIYDFVTGVATLDGAGGLSSPFNSQPATPFIAGVSQIVLGSNYYLMGGFTGLDYTNQVSVYPLDPTSGAPGTATSTSLPEKSSGQRNVLIHGQVYVIGGLAMGGPPDPSVAPLK